MIDLLEKALEEYGVSEIKGEKHTPRILQYFKDIGHKWVKSDETAWCSAFVNWCAKSCGYEYTKKLNARSWLKIGKKIEKPKQGCIVVFWRERKDSWKGHVAIYVHHDKNYIYVLGGNQSNRVRVSAYPINRLLEYRELKKL